MRAEGEERGEAKERSLVRDSFPEVRNEMQQNGIGGQRLCFPELPSKSFRQALRSTDTHTVFPLHATWWAVQHVFDTSSPAGLDRPAQLMSKLLRMKRGTTAQATDAQS